MKTKHSEMHEEVTKSMGDYAKTSPKMMGALYLSVILLRIKQVINKIKNRCGETKC
jgi:hypothetical protein